MHLVKNNEDGTLSLTSFATEYPTVVPQTLSEYTSMLKARQLYEVRYDIDYDRSTHKLVECPPYLSGGYAYTTMLEPLNDVEKLKYEGGQLNIRLRQIDEESVRALRAILAGADDPRDQEKLKDLNGEAASARERLQSIRDSLASLAT